MAEISVVIPCYNHARYLRAALDSVGGQTVTPRAVILVDDGSTDNTRDVAHAWLQHYPEQNLWVVRTDENLGLGAALNAGIACAGDNTWILRLDADDALMANAIETLSNVSSPEYFNLVTFPLEDYGGPHARIWNPSTRIRLEQLESRNIFPYCAAFPKSLWAAIGGFDEGECSRLGINDWEFWQRAHRQVGLHPVRINAPLVRYRQHAGPRLSDQFKGRDQVVRRALERAARKRYGSEESEERKSSHSLS